MPLLSFLLPLRCAGCDAAGSLWCRACAQSLERLPDPRCLRCGAPTRWPVERCRECRGRRLRFHRAWAAVAHRDAAARLVRRWKDHGLDLSRVAADAILAQRPRAPLAGAAVVPVPGDADRIRWRGVDGPQALAERLATAWGLESRPDLLVRRHGVPPQRRLDALARRRNLAAAFGCGAHRSGPAILVDDVYTTGATADACAERLADGGAYPILVVTFARALRR